MEGFHSCRCASVAFPSWADSGLPPRRMTDSRPDPIAARKRELREQLRDRRRSLDPATRESADRAINRAVMELARELPDGAIAGFRAFDGEPDLTHALAEIARSGRPLVLPVLTGEPGPAGLEFRAWDPGGRLHTNRFGIAEPRAGNRVPIEDIGLLLIPLVGWDRHGGRLGMGAGFYDRALACRSDSARPWRAGVAYTAQRVDRVPTDDHDVPLHLVLSEDGRFTCQP